MSISRKRPGQPTLRIQRIPVNRIRPEDGLGRKRDREGHRDLCRSIEQFGVLTPITVRRAPGRSGDYLLIKGQGRTLACRLLGIDKIPAVIVSDRFAENEKVQQFLVENVARLRMRPIDRALLIAHARQKGEETTEVAARFGVSAVTVRRLEAQLDGASYGEVAALRSWQCQPCVARCHRPTCCFRGAGQGYPDGGCTFDPHKGDGSSIHGDWLAKSLQVGRRFARTEVSSTEVGL